MRLRVFGDSFCAGDGLVDPSRQAWSAHLTKMRRFNGCVNRGTPGAGNSEILDTVFETDFHPGDVAIIQWSNCQRHTNYELHPNEKRARARTLDRGNTDKLRALSRIIHDDAHVHYTQQRMFAAQAHIQNYPNVIVYHLTAHIMPPTDYRAKFFKSFPQQIDLRFREVDGNYTDLATDDAHPGPKCHWQFAKDLNSRIQLMPNP